MSLAELEAELENLSMEDLCRLGGRISKLFTKKEAGFSKGHMCNEGDPVLLAALDNALVNADTLTSKGLSADEIRTRLGEWTSK